MPGGKGIGALCFRHKQEFLAQFHNEGFHMPDQGFLQIVLTVGFGQPQKFKHIIIFEGLIRAGL